MLELTDSLKDLFKETAQSLKDSESNRFMAKVVAELGQGGSAKRNGKSPVVSSMLMPSPCGAQTRRKPHTSIIKQFHQHCLSSESN